MKKAIIAAAILCTVVAVSCVKQQTRRCFTCTITSTTNGVTSVKSGTYCDTTPDEMNSVVEYQKRIYGIIYSCK